MNKCKHILCDQIIKPEYDLCFYHHNEMINNGKSGFWNCDWCKEYKELNEMVDIEEERNLIYNER